VSITKNQLDAINSGALSKIGQNAEDPSFKPTNLLEEILIGVATKITDELKKDIERKGLVSTRNLVDSINAERTYKVADGVTAEIVAADYWPQVDQGQKPGTIVSIKSLEEWAANKRQMRQELGLNTKEQVKSFAVVVARKIKQKGTIKRFGYKGANFVRDVLNPTTINAIAQHLGEALGQRIAISVKMVEGTPQE
jgi:hypothetical protein